ncbi:MAG: hypothetical protein ACYC27_12065 [Armatimonadota bacterium]
MKHDASVAESTERSDVDAAADAYISVEFVYSTFTDKLRLPDFVGPEGRQPFDRLRTIAEATPARVSEPSVMAVPSLLRNISDKHIMT